MTMLDWSFVALLSGALLFFLFGLLFIIFRVSTGRKLKPFNRKPPKNKRKRKQFIRQKRQLEKQKKRQRNSIIILFLLAIVAVSGAFYSRYYQMNRLETKDSEAIVQSYYLLDELELQLNNVKEGENPQKSIKTLRELSMSLSSYGARHAYYGLAEDGQLLLNRHFTILKELGVNLSSQTTDKLQNSEVLEGYYKDIEKARESQKKVFERFNVNESALKNKQ